MSLSGEQLKALARQGAAQRYQELQEELAALTATFPELARGGGGKRRASAAPKSASRRRRSMNAAQRKEVSERMTRYWAARRAAKATEAVPRPARPRVVAASPRRRPPSRRPPNKATGDSTRLEHGGPMSDPVSLASLFDAAEQAAMSGDFAAAARLLGEAARAQEAALGPDHLDLANTLNNLAVAHERCGQLDAAEREYRRAHAIAARTRPADDPLVTTSAQNLREFCEANGRPVDVPPSAMTLADDIPDPRGRSGHAPVFARPPAHADAPTGPTAADRSRSPCAEPAPAKPRPDPPAPDAARPRPAAARRNRRRRRRPSRRLPLPRPRPRRHPRRRTRRGAACRFRSSSRSAPSPRS